MDPITLGLVLGGGAGLLKGMTVDKAKEDRDINLAAATQQFSPWTGLKAQPIHYADPFGSAMQFGATGAMMGAGIENQAQQKNLMADQNEWLGRRASTFGSSPNSMSSSSSPWNFGMNYQF